MKELTIGPALPVELEGVREHGEGFPVELRTDEDSGRIVIRAINEGGHNTTHVDLLDLIEWLKRYSDAFGGVTLL